MSDPTPPSVTVVTDNNSDNDNTAPTDTNVPTPPTLLPASITQPTTSAIAIGLYAPKEEVAANPFADGLDITHFMECKQTSQNLCGNAKDPSEFATCLKRNQTPICNQFVAFATRVGMSSKDDVDLIKHYQPLDLLHLVRFGANYPGVYYTIGMNGDIVDLIFGPQMAGLDIRKDPHYAEIATRYPRVALFSIVDKLPKVFTLPEHPGIEVILRFQLLNGCHTCEQAGYAYVAYDFSKVGALQSVTIQSMEPVL